MQFLDDSLLPENQEKLKMRIASTKPARSGIAPTKPCGSSGWPRIARRV
jgi:hypothetical protein